MERTKENYLGKPVFDESGKLLHFDNSDFDSAIISKECTWIAYKKRHPESLDLIELAKWSTKKNIELARQGMRKGNNP